MAKRPGLYANIAAKRQKALGKAIKEGKKPKSNMPMLKRGGSVKKKKKK